MEEDVPVFNAQALLDATCDDKELASQVVGVFLTDIPVQLHDLEAAVKSGDAKTAERTAHSIKGASATVGGEKLRAIALDCETFGREGKLEALGAKLEALRACFDELVAVMRENGFAGE